MKRSAAAAPVTIPLLCLALAVSGYFGPWIDHKTAALTRTGFELSEFAKLFPQVQSGEVGIIRAFLFTPPIAGGLALSALIYRHKRGNLVRVAGTIFGILLALTAIPPYEYLGDPQYRGQLVLAAGGLLLVLLSPLTRWLSARAHNGVTVVLAVVGAVPALWQFSLLRPIVAAVYNKPIQLGWGLMTCSIGYAALLVYATTRMIQGDPRGRSLDSNGNAPKTL